MAVDISCEALERRLKEKIVGVEHVKVEGGEGGKFHALVVSDIFRGMPLLQQQRAVFKALEEEMKEMHALTMKCYTLEKWSNEQSSK